MFRRSNVHSPLLNKRKSAESITNLDPLIDLQQSIARLMELVQLIQQENHIMGAKSGSKSDIGTADVSGNNHHHRNIGSRKKPSYANILKSQEDSNVHSYFLTMSISNEEDMIELIRHIFDLAIKGEQRAARSSDSALLSNENDSNNIKEEQVKDAVQEATEEPSKLKPLAANSNAIFEYFCEVNALSIITNIATGQAFITTTATNATITTTDIHLYPPISIAIQIIQSVSILVTNLSKVTSLYYILSNNKINDLIHFPIGNYKRAEYNKTQSHKNSSNKKVDISSIGELSEMEAAYVMMLKSLCMRMNAETLQFYMQYDPTGGKILDIPLYTMALEFLDPALDDFIRVTAMNICMNTLRLITRVDKIHHDSSDDDDGDSDTTQSHSTTKHRNDNKIPDPAYGVQVPNSSLYQSKPLPFRERLALAKFVCLPTHVESLTRGIFLRLTNLCTVLDDALRNMNRIHRECIMLHRSENQMNDIMTPNQNSNIDKTLLEIDEHSRLENYHKRMDGLHSQRTKAMTMFQNAVSDLLNEFMFLDDLLKVGLIPLNEQIIENMFAAVIYPLLLTPLLRFNQQFQRKLHVDATGSISSNANNNLMHRNQSITAIAEGISTNSESSLSKTSLFVIGSIFRHIRHDHLLKLLATALLHPMAPIGSDDLVLSSLPDFIFEDKHGHAYISSDELQIAKEVNLYHFGTQSSLSNNSIDPKTTTRIPSSMPEICHFIFTPGLYYMLQNNFSENGTVSSPMKDHLKSNPFRRMLLCCLAGTDGMVELQSLAVYAVDSILAHLNDEMVKMTCLDFHTEKRKDNDRQNNSSGAVTEVVSDTSDALSNLNISYTSTHLVEFITSLCVSVMTSYKTHDGSWCLKYNCIAAHAIYYICKMDETVKNLVLKIMEQRKRQSLSFILEIPSRLEKKLPESQRTTLDRNLVMDRIFFEPFCKGGKFIMEYISHPSHIDPSESDQLWCGPYYISILKDDDFAHDLLEDICEDVSQRRIFQSDPEEAAYKGGANSIVAFLQMDSLVQSLRDGSSIDVRCHGLHSKRKDKRSTRMAPVSDTFSELLFQEGDWSDDAVPEAGSTMSLVGKPAYPCVCELKEENDGLFHSSASYVVSDGIKWQSVYLVVSGSYLILTEPVGESGGDGRIVTCCALTSIVAIYDETLNVDLESSTARRIFLRHVSFSSRRDPPDLFTIRMTTQDSTSNVNHESFKDQVVRVVQSHLDLWFQDESAARKALKTLSSKIFKARLKRGEKILTTLRLMMEYDGK